jgi:hypothetical protein
VDVEDGAEAFRFKPHGDVQVIVSLNDWLVSFTPGFGERRVTIDRLEVVHKYVVAIIEKFVPNFRTLTGAEFGKLRPVKDDPATDHAAWQAKYGKGFSAWMRSRAQAGEFSLPRDVYLARIKGQPMLIVDRLGRVQTV